MTNDLVTENGRGLAAEITVAAKNVRSSLENPAVSLTDPAAWHAMFGAWHSAIAGVTVTTEKALSVPAVWAAVDFIASTIATLPLHLYRRGENGVREMAHGDPLQAVLHDDVNAEMTSYAWRKLAMQNVLLGGRCYTFIERNTARRVINLWPLEPEKVTVEKVQGRKRYLYRENGRVTAYDAADIIDIPWMLQADGVRHYRPVSQFRNAFALAIALKEYAGKFFQNGGVPPLQAVGPFETPGAIERAGEDITEALKAAKKDGRPVLPMPRGHELKPIGVDPEKGQLTEARRAQLEEIARIYRVPPVFLQDLSHGTRSTTEQQDLHVVKHTLSQWLKAWEQELNLKLFGPRRRARFVEFNVDGILRGDFRSRIEGLARGIQNALYTPDEGRGMLNMPPQGGEGAKLHIQGATVPLGQQSKSGGTPPAPAPQNEPAEPDDDTD